MPVHLLSLGDYVLNGGEVAALAMVEAVARLLPGVLGNAESLEEESHEDGLLEYPVYTRPASWRGRDVPPVLLSGHHAPGSPVATGRATAPDGDPAARPAGAARPGRLDRADLAVLQACGWVVAARPIWLGVRVLWQTDLLCRRPATPCHRGVRRLLRAREGTAPR